MDVINHYHNGGIQYVKYLIHTFCVYMFVLCVLVVLFSYWALKSVMVPDSTGLYVGLVGWCDIHCSFCQLSGGVCYPTNLCIHFMLHVALCQTYSSVKLSIVSSWNVILSMSYFVFLSLFLCINFITFWNQYTDSIVQ